VAISPWAVRPWCRRPSSSGTQEEKAAKLRQKDREARWSVKYTKAKVNDDAHSKAFKPVDLAIPMFGYKNHIGIDRTHGLIRTWDASAANAHDGARLPVLISSDNTASGVWADTAYRSKKNEAFLAKGMFTSNIHQRKPHRRPMLERIARANAKRSTVRSAVEHVFACQKHRMGSSCIPSAWPEHGSRSVWPIWSITSSGSPGSRGVLRPRDADPTLNGPIISARARKSLPKITPLRLL